MSDGGDFSNSFHNLKTDFPVLGRKIHNNFPLVYLDSAATSQKPTSVIETMADYYRKMNANIHRGVHTLAEEATAAYETARLKVADFIGATTSQEIIFTRNTTESINLVAKTWGQTNLNPGDVILLTEMEHHSNLVPWQMLAAEKQLQLEFVPVNDQGALDLTEYERLLSLQPRLVSFTHMSNVLGTINPAKEMIQAARKAGAVTLLDAAQSIPHLAVNVKDLDVDFLAFSAHKMLGPTGIGVLWGRKNLLEAMPPFLGGGDMIKKVYLRSFSANDLPHKFEAGTPAIAEAIGLGSAIDYLQKIGMNAVLAHEQMITAYALEKLTEISGLKPLGPQNALLKGGVIAFTLDGIHPHDVAQILDSRGIAVRAGHHCAMPLHEILQAEASTRASFYIYNDKQDVDRLIEGLHKVKQVFG